MNDISNHSYQVLARKYRPTSFHDFIGQDSMVRILKNAFAINRIAHAFILTGIRGVGKTTTARIIAKGINCLGVDGKGKPTVTPCQTCDSCITIAAGRHIDVLEIDAASRTGVNDMREIIDSAQYRATSARYKVYIIDEVHMLSTSAFNALLKTLEAPPAHVKFIFATTEIRKIPLTILSRCQRFDLRRIEPQAMNKHLLAIAQKEQCTINQDAIALIIRAAEGSVRDALSLLDQAITYGGGENINTITADHVRDMLGLADRARVLDLFEFIMRGDAVNALNTLAEHYHHGGEPLAILRDLAEVIHWVSIIKVSPAALQDQFIPPAQRQRGMEAAQKLTIPTLTRSWQILLKALNEVVLATNPLIAAEMVIIRLIYVAELPSPEYIIRKLHNSEAKDTASNNQTTTLKSQVTATKSSIANGSTVTPIRKANKINSITNNSSITTISQTVQRNDDLKMKAYNHPLVQKALHLFEGSKIIVCTVKDQ